MTIEPSERVTGEDLELALTLVEAIEEAQAILLARYGAHAHILDVGTRLQQALVTAYTFTGLLYVTHEQQREAEDDLDA